MNVWDKIKIFIHLLRWITNWKKVQANYIPAKVKTSKFITAREAVSQIKDNSVVISSGIAGSNRCSVFFWSLRDLYLQTGHPQNLTWITNSAQGGRGKIPGTIEEIGLKGLLSVCVAGHCETHKAILKLADAGLVELHTMPQGQISELVKAQALGKYSYLSDVGLSTFLDPTAGTGSAVTKNCKQSFIVRKENMLEYSLSKIEYAFLLATGADTEGNIYIKNIAVFYDAREAALAAKANGGKVFVTVAQIVPKNWGPVFLTAEQVDGIIVNKYNEQTASIPQLKYWDMFLVNSKVNVNKSLLTMRYLNNIMKITPKRDKIDEFLAKIAASLFVSLTKPGACVNFGVGLPEDVARSLAKYFDFSKYTFLTEAGAVGGIPGSGLFFGTAISPQKLLSASEIFDFMDKNLETAILGMVEVDELGDVNVSRRGPNPSQFVGPGGFTNITSAAKTIIFVGSFMVRGEYKIEGDALKIVKLGACKFTKRVLEITFSAAEAHKQSKQIYYVTQIGIFKYTVKGLELISVTKGIDVKKDIIDFAGINITVSNSLVVQPVVTNLFGR